MAGAGGAMRRDRLSAVTLHQLRIFAAVARERGFIKAAAALYLTEATVSEQIKLLETRLGVKLVDRARGRSGIEVTQAGRVLLASCDRVFEALDQAAVVLDALAGQVLGTVSVGTGMTFGGYVLPTICEEFKRFYPGVTVHVESAPRGRVLDTLTRGELDLAVLFGPCSEGRKLVSEPLGECELVLVGPPGHRLAAGLPAPFSELARESLILDDPSAVARQAIEQMAAETGTTLNVALELSNDEAQRESVMRGLGVAVLSTYSVAERVAAGQLAVLHVRGFPIRPQWLVLHRPIRLSPAAEAFKQHLLGYRGRIQGPPGPWTREQIGVPEHR